MIVRSRPSLLAALLCLTAAGGAQAEDPRHPLPAPVSDADYAPVDEAEARLGWLLFYDPILSGNREVSCATCHHPRFATSDGLSLGIGDGGVGLGPARRGDPANLPEQRIPRNSPALFNLGAREFSILFADGRIQADPAAAHGVRTPLEDDMAAGFGGVLAAQTMFPVLSPDEMAGHYSENPVAQAVRMGRITGPGGAWDIIARRVAAIDAYADAFAAVYPKIAAGAPIGFADVSNAIAAFIAFEWRSDASPFDAHLRGGTPLTGPAAEGMTLFYGEAGCAACHAGPFQTDHRFYAMGAAQIGPGKAARFERHARDEGRMRVTGDPSDAYAFRTPSLRNVARTGPYGHAGARSDLRDFVAAHARRGAALADYVAGAATLPPLPVDDLRAMDDPTEVAAIAATAGNGRALAPAEVASLAAFLEALSDPVALTGRLGVPEAVPSGLPVAR